MTYICTKETPWNTTIPTPVQHPDAQVDLEYDNDYCEMYECPHCSLVFKVVLPE